MWLLEDPGGGLGCSCCPLSKGRREGRNCSRVTSPSWPQGEGESRSKQLFTERLMNVLPRWMQSGFLAAGGKGTGAGEGERRRPPAPQGHAATVGVRAPLSQQDYSISSISTIKKTTAFVFVWFLTKAPILHSQDSWSRGLGTSRECSH